MTRAKLQVIPISALVAVVVTVFLFAMLPLLTQVQERVRSGPRENRIMLMSHKPPKPIDVEKERRRPRTKKLKKMKKSKTKSRSARKPKMNAPQFEFARGMGEFGEGMASIGMGKFKGLESIGKIGFELSEVDQPPRPVRKFNPIYPFAAKRQGTTGKVYVRCLINKDGTASRFSIVRSKPKGVFDEVAVAAVQKWRFKPGILAGRPVPTWVQIPLTFELN